MINHTFAQVVIEELKKGPTIVDFWAEWCQPCKQISKELDRLAKMKPINILRVNVDSRPDAVKEYEVKTIPCLLYFSGPGATPKQLNGFVSAEEMIRRFRI
jgi:putative thioredoxin